MTTIAVRDVRLFVERRRAARELGFDTWAVLGHSYGGKVALGDPAAHTYRR